MNEMQFQPYEVYDNEDIIGVNSSIYRPITYTLNPFTHIRVKIWTWEGDLYLPYNNATEPDVILYEEKLNPSDTAIVFEFSDYLKTFKTNNFQYGGINKKFVRFFKYEYDIINNPLGLALPPVVTTLSSQTFIINEGWKWNYESNYDGYNPSFLSFGRNYSVVNTRRNPLIRNNNYGYSIEQYSTDDSAVQMELKVIPNNLIACQKDPYLIVYMSKDGYWRELTPTGKVVTTSKSKKETYSKGISRPDMSNNKIEHSRKVYSVEATEEYNINTGQLSEAESQYYEELLYSNKVYLIKFNDSSIVAGEYNRFEQMAVVVKDSDFVRKTKINDKNKISYNFVFELATNKIR